jgi:outer membrane protein assembly factor BamA
MRAPFSRRVAVAGCVAVAAAVPVAARAQTLLALERPEVRKLVINGVHHVDPLDLEKSIETQQSSCRNVIFSPVCRWISRAPWLMTKHLLDRDQLAKDIIRIRVYYFLHGYRSAAVDTSVTPNATGVTVTFNVTENQPTLVRRVSIAYDSTLISEKRIKKQQLLKSGQPFDLTLLDSMRVLYADEMWAAGHSDAQVDTVITIDSVRRLADVHLDLIPNHTTIVGPISIQGLSKVSQATVLNSITFHSGDLFRQGDVLESQRNLFESSLFRLAAVQVPAQFDSVKKVTITVVEAPLHETNLSAGFTNVDFVQTQAQYTAYNLLGGARKLDVSGSLGNLFANSLVGKGFFYDPAVDIAGADNPIFLQPTWTASVDFSQPAFLRRPSNQAGFGVFAHRRSTPGIFIDRGYGGNATFTNHFATRASVSATYQFEANRVEAGDVYFCINFGVCDTLAIQTLRTHQRLSPVMLTALIDRSDDPLDPTRGYLARVDLEHASTITASDYTYDRAFFDIAAYNHTGYANTYAAHLRIGWVHGSGSIHPRKLFYAGGASSVRGFATNQLGPRILTIAPNRLTDSTKGGHCTTATIADVSCNPNAVDSLKDSEFNPQPLGGTSLVEGSVEFRIPIGFQRKLTLAGFIDGAIVGSGSLPSLDNFIKITKGTGAITPGMGIRYKSPVGPIRVDVGYNPEGKESLPVATETDINGVRKIVLLKTPRVYQPMKHLLDRLTLHLSIGQAY